MGWICLKSVIGNGVIGNEKYNIVFFALAIKSYALSLSFLALAKESIWQEVILRKKD